MKPTQEQVEAAKGVLLCFGRDVTPSQIEASIAAFLAARDAERDAKWEAFVAAWDASFQLIHECGAGRFLGFLEPVRKARAALANLGAEEKPKPEPKCGECGTRREIRQDAGKGDGSYTWIPCPSCSGGKP